MLGVKEMTKLGMGALLGVGQGSDRESQLVTMQWNGAGKEKPIAFVGKGVTFDTGGISIKPAAGMEDMKWDMAGSAAVIGTMRALAARKAKVNAVGVVGLVENMPSGTAQRPGDIVTSMSGQTIEVLNTDAEGRLVLADAMWYCQETFKPKVMIDLATLTGAILIALGNIYGGMYANDDDLAKQLESSGKATGELLWRMPLAAAYNKMMDSPAADMKNISGSRNAGSITAAEFLQRFVQKGTHLVAPRHRRHGLGRQGQPDLAARRHRLRRAAARPPGRQPLRRGVIKHRMSEIRFYHLQRASLEDTLPVILERAYGRGDRILVMTGSNERAEALASHLWTYRPESFLPHGTAKDGDAGGAADLPHRRGREPERGEAADPVRRRDPRRLR